MADEGVKVEVAAEIAANLIQAAGRQKGILDPLVAGATAAVQDLAAIITAREVVESKAAEVSALATQVADVGTAVEGLTETIDQAQQNLAGQVTAAEVFRNDAESFRGQAEVLVTEAAQSVIAANERIAAADTRLAAVKQEADQKLAAVTQASDQKLAEVQQATDQKLTEVEQAASLVLTNVTQEADQILINVQQEAAHSLDLANQTVSQVAANYNTLAAANAVIASFVEGAGINVLSDGANSGFYVKQGGTWVLQPGVPTLPALDTRLTAAEIVTAPQAAESVYSSYELLADDYEVDADDRVMRRTGVDGYEYFVPVKASKITTDTQVLGGQTVTFLDTDEYALSGYHDVTVDEDFRVISASSGGVSKSGDTMTGPLYLFGNASQALQAVPLQQAQSLIAAASTPKIRRGTLEGALMGDSRTDISFAGSKRTLMQPRAAAFWLQLESKGAIRIRKEWNFGVSGETTTQMLARMDAALVTAANADFFIILGETNDALGEDSIGNIQTMVNKMLAAGKMAWVVAELPRGDTTAYTGSTWSTARINQHLKAREAMLRMAAQPGVRVINAWPDLIDPASSIAAPLSGLFYDELHLTCEAARRVGKAIWSGVSDLARTEAPLVLTNADKYDATNTYGNLIGNGMLTGTAGTKSGTGAISGSVADNWNLASTSSYTVTASKTTRGGREGQQISFSGTAVNASQSIVLSQTLDIAKYAAGDVVELMAYIEADAGSVDMYGPELVLIVNDSDSALSVGYQPPATATSPNPTVAYGGPYIAQKYTIPSDLTSLAVAIQVKGKSGALMSGTFWVSNASLRKQ